jgi:hypothetical protein
MKLNLDGAGGSTTRLAGRRAAAPRLEAATEDAPHDVGEDALAARTGLSHETLLTWLLVSGLISRSLEKSAP